MEKQKNIKHVVIIVPPYSTLLDTCGPMDVFQRAIDQMKLLENRVDFTYHIHVVSTTKARQIPVSSGISIVSEGSYKNITYPVDTLIVPGLPQKTGYQVGKDVLAWLKEQSGHVRRICSVCAGAFMLAEAGVLTGKKATTHWMLCEKLAKNYPQTTVDPEAIFVKDGNVYTSAGITTGMDLALGLIEEDLGKSFALQIARIMVLYLKRPGNQTQYSTVLESQQIDHQPIRKAVEWIYDHLQEEITVEKLAEHTLMSPRNFARVFARELNITPIKYVEKLRLEAAIRYLTETHLTTDEIAHLCGLKNSTNLNRLFLHTFEVTPTQYRRNFQTSFSR
ncbi:MAG: GlxA family transcriptional regulator [Tannerellaceae bacterium]|nr:GlxA family transcriptional regulator [Tannerellaceae bacterium]